MKKILYVTSYDANSRKSWSGVLYSINQELKKYYDVNYLVVANPVGGVLDKIKNKISKVFTGKGGLYSHSVKRALMSTKLLVDELSKEHYDAVFAIDCSCLYGVKTDVPIIYYSDGLVSVMIDYYWSNMKKSAIDEANQIQKVALEKSAYTILTSQWAKDAAIRDYGINPEKVRIVHTGANVEEQEFKGIQGVNCKDSDKEINLLFCGVEWERKGGDIAVETARSLKKIDTNRRYVLHMYGCTPPYEITDDNIKLYGFLNRDDPEQKKTFYDLWKNADFFISPLKADCAAASFCEACAYGVPSITFDTGGIADHVINDFNGYRLPVGSSAEDFARKIIELVTNKETLNKMKANAREYYLEDLNWQVAGRKIKEIIDSSIY